MSATILVQIINIVLRKLIPLAHANLNLTDARADTKKRKINQTKITQQLLQNQVMKIQKTNNFTTNRNQTATRKLIRSIWNL